MNSSSTSETTRSLLWFFPPGVLLIGFLFRSQFLPENTLFCNDGTFGHFNAYRDVAVSFFLGAWHHLNWLGTAELSGTPTPSFFFYLLFGPLLHAKFFAPFSLLCLGASTVWGLRRFGISRGVAIVGGLAMMLHSNPFSYACWGLAGKSLAMSAVWLCLGGLAQRPLGHRGWMITVASGLILGVNLTEGGDIGALFCLYVAAFAMYRAWVQPGSAGKRLTDGGLQTVILAVCAGLVSIHSLSALIGTQIKGVAVLNQASGSESLWQFITGWSFPPDELTRLIVPGVYGFRMDTPEGGAYWGTVGSEGGGRFSGSGEYPGLLVLGVAVWAVLRAATSRERQPFSLLERKWIGFWAVLCLVSLLLAFGHYTPLYRLIYQLPFFSTMRIPMKFLHPFAICTVVLFAYGLEGIWRSYLLSNTGVKSDVSEGLLEHLKSWWQRANGLDRKWVLGSALAVLFGFLWAIIHASSKAKLIAAIEKVPAAIGTSEQVVAFSIHQVWIFAFFLLVCAIWLMTIFSGWWAGRRAQTALLVTGALIVGDLVVANQPWVIAVNYQRRYQSNPVVDVLREKPWEQRVTAFLDPRRVAFENAGLPGGGRNWLAVHNLWLEHHFQYYGIETLDIIQMPRMPELDKQFIENFLPAGGALNPSDLARRWQLTNTRYILGVQSLVPILNQAFDPVAKRFSVRIPFSIVPKPDIQSDADLAKGDILDNLTAVPTTNGPLALIEFSGALPRAKLYSQWETPASDAQSLQRLKDGAFDPMQKVLVSESIGASTANLGPAGTATILKYQAKKVVIQCQASSPSVLLLNDRWNPDWEVIVDHRKAKLLRANFIMRGVEIPAGQHEVEFYYNPPHNTLYVSVASLAFAIGLVSWLCFAGPKYADQR